LAYALPSVECHQRSRFSWFDPVREAGGYYAQYSQNVFAVVGDPRAYGGSGIVKSVRYRYTDSCMAVSFAGKIVAGLLAVTLMRPVLMTARDTNLTVWENLRQLTVAQEIEVTTSDHKSVQGTFLAFSDQFISLRRKQKDITIPRPDVVRVRLHSSRGRTHMLIGAASGGGAGAGVGA